MIDLAFDTSGWSGEEGDLFRVSPLIRDYVPTVVGDLCGISHVPFLFSKGSSSAASPKKEEQREEEQGKESEDQKLSSFTKSILPQIESLLTFLTKFVEEKKRGKGEFAESKQGEKDPAEQLINLISHFGGKVASLLIRGEQNEKTNETQKLLQSRLFRDGISSSLYLSLRKTAPPSSSFLSSPSEEIGEPEEEEVYDPSNDPEQQKFLDSLVEREEGSDGDMVLSALERYGGELQMTAKYDDKGVIKFSRLFFACAVKHANRVGDCLTYAMDVRDVWGKGDKGKKEKGPEESGIDESEAFRPPVWMLRLLKHSQEMKAFIGSTRQEVLRKMREEKGLKEEETEGVGEEDGEGVTYSEILNPYFAKANFLLKLSPLTRTPSSSLCLSSSSQRPPPSVIQQWVNTKNDSADLSNHSFILLVISEIEHFLKHTHFNLEEVSEEITLRSKFCSQRTKSLQFIRKLLLLTTDHPSAQQHILRFVACCFRSAKVEPLHFLENTAGVPPVYVELCRSVFEGLLGDVLGLLENEVRLVFLFFFLFFFFLFFFLFSSFCLLRPFHQCRHLPPETCCHGCLGDQTEKG